MNLTIKHCFDYVRSLHSTSVCGIRGNLYETLIVRVARHATGKSQGFAYEGGNILYTPEGRVTLSPQVARIAQAFEDCRANDFGAYDVDENGLTQGVYTRLPCGKWVGEYRRMDTLKALSPDIYRRDYVEPRLKYDLFRHMKGHSHDT